MNPPQPRGECPSAGAVRPGPAHAPWGITPAISHLWEAGNRRLSIRDTKQLKKKSALVRFHQGSRPISPPLSSSAKGTITTSIARYVINLIACLYDLLMSISDEQEISSCKFPLAQPAAFFDSYTSGIDIEHHVSIIACTYHHC